MGSVKDSIITLLVMLILSLDNVLPGNCFTSFVFGDSLVDAGNNDYFFTLSKANSPPYGIDFKPSGGQPTGRFTNGLTISDIVGQEFGDKSFPPPYLAPNTQMDAITGGLNYASGASGILDETGLLFIGRVPLRQQVRNFEESRNYMVEMIGENNTREFLRKAIFSLTIGSNDVLNYVQPSVPFFSGEKVSPDIFQDYMVSNLSLHLKRLHELGGRKFIVVGVGPLGCIPFVRALHLLPKGECSTKVNQLIQGYNTKLAQMLTGLNQQFGPQSVFICANSFDIVLSIILNYHQYGFEEAYKPCCGGYFPPFVCYKGRNEKNESMWCDDRSKYVFWDAYHPTQSANFIIAKKLLDGDQTVSFPLNIRQLYYYTS